MTNDQSDKTFHPNRRGFLGVAAATGAASLAPGVLIGTAATTAALAEASEPAPSQSVDASASTIAAKLPSPVPGYLSFGPDEAGFVEAMVNVMCPADALTPGGVDCGLAVYIDRQLAGGFGKGARLYMRGPWREGKPSWAISCRSHPSSFSRRASPPRMRPAGNAMARPFVNWIESGADRFLHEIADGKVTDERVQLASWFNELVYPLFEQACFADPDLRRQSRQGVLEGDRLSGLPAVHAQNMVRVPRQALPGRAESEIHRRLQPEGEKSWLHACKHRTVVFVGGGLTAALAARQLTAKGVDVLVLERGIDHTQACRSKTAHPARRTALGRAWQSLSGLVGPDLHASP